MYSHPCTYSQEYICVECDYVSGLLVGGGLLYSNDTATLCPCLSLHSPWPHSVDRRDTRSGHTEPSSASYIQNTPDDRRTRLSKSPRHESTRNRRYYPRHQLQSQRQEQSWQWYSSWWSGWCGWQRNWKIICKDVMSSRVDSGRVVRAI